MTKKTIIHIQLLDHKADVKQFIKIAKEFSEQNKDKYYILYSVGKLKVAIVSEEERQELLQLLMNWNE